MEEKFSEQDRNIDKKLSEQDRNIDKKFSDQDRIIDKKFSDQDRNIYLLVQKVERLKNSTTVSIQDVNVKIDSLQVIHKVDKLGAVALGSLITFKSCF
jgi:hypothetical protein